MKPKPKLKWYQPFRCGNRFWARHGGFRLVVKSVYLGGGGVKQWRSEVHTDNNAVVRVGKNKATIDNAKIECGRVLYELLRDLCDALDNSCKTLGYCHEYD